MPTEELCLQVMECFGITSFKDDHSFTRKDIESRKTVERLTALIKVLEPYYLPCKARSYLTQLNSKNVVTILRHFVRIFGHRVQSKEKNTKGEKFITYNLKSLTQESTNKLAYSKKNDTCVLEFD